MAMVAVSDLPFVNDEFEIQRDYIIFPKAGITKIAKYFQDILILKI